MIRTVSRDELPAIRALLARANDTPYDLEKVAEEKCFGRGVEGEPIARVFGDYRGIAVTCGKFLRILAVDRGHRRQGIGSALLEDTNATVAAAEPGNYFIPGVLDPTFLAKRSWRETASTHNLEAAALGRFAIPENVRSDRRAEVLTFIEREFGRIWRFESERAATIFHIEHEGAIAGFAAHDANNHGLGFFGPTGVAKSLRGRGFGRALLLASLADLQRLGYARAVIPWTDAIEFYRRSCGAVVTHRFVTMER